MKMKLSNVIDDKIRESLLSENERALRSLVNGRDFATIIPMHTSNMRIIVDDNSMQDDIRRVIVPKLAIYVDNRGVKDGLIDRDHVGYKIAYNKAAFPIAHVFDESGWLCLGNIFVPNRIPVHSPQQPLETLMLHNDRNKSHGHPQLSTDKSTRTTILQLLKTEFGENTEFPFDVMQKDWVGHDTLWRIGNYLLENRDKDRAYQLMEPIFKIIFAKNE